MQQQDPDLRIESLEPQLNNHHRSNCATSDVALSVRDNDGAKS